MLNKEPDQQQLPTSLTNGMNKRYLNLHPYVELAQQIMDSPVCEINIFDSYYQKTVAHNVDEAVYKDIICYDAIMQNGETYEIEDLTKNKRFKDHSYVKHPPYFKYYCSAKLTNNNSGVIGSIYVLDTKSKSVSNEQKDQLRQLALLVMDTIEYESEYRKVKAQLGAVSDSIHQLNHDVRTPISGIVGISDILLDEKDHVEFPDEELTMIKEAAETILNIIDDVLGGIDINHYEQEQGKKQLAHIVEQLKRLFHPPSKAKGVSLTIDNQVDADLQVTRSFSLKLLQITSNLLSNAVKFSPQNGGIEVTLTRKKGKNKNDLCITITDNGQGMTAEQIAAFNNGTSVAQSAGTNGEQSFGKGLTYVKQVVAEAGGTISAKAGESNGMQFLVSLPIPNDNVNQLLSLLRDA